MTLSAREAAILAIKEPPQVVKHVVVGLAEWASGEAEGELSGPVGMVSEAAKVVRGKRGFVEFLFLLGSLSAYLGAFNLIPFPALDGGRLMFLGYEATTRRRPNARIEMHIHLVGLMMMIGLTFYVTLFKDLRRQDNDAPAAQPPAMSSGMPDPGAPNGAASQAAPSQAAPSQAAPSQAPPSQAAPSPEAPSQAAPPPAPPGGGK
jgi:regulator of sigma E protease